MAKNTGKGSRKGAVTSRTQVKTPGGWTKRDSSNGQFLDRKSDSAPFKGVTKEK
ncbi:hypothetical protein LX13_001868 [Williamsia maris]|uniref:Uncharacterized protein n=1 Tax=Williamsia maris TaxID=72806 RepID=A0ABT1HD05_9NOCA|nr:hypothetical protein [Williamsia maris]